VDGRKIGKYILV